MVDIAYLILAHESPAQLSRLVNALGGSSAIFIHVDSKTDDATFDAMRQHIASQNNVTFVERHVCWWGGPGMVQATLSLIAAALRSGQSFDYATLLSGTDYPIQPAAAIRAFLTENAGAEFIESFDMAKPNRWSDDDGKFRAPDRVTRFHLRWKWRVLKTALRRRLPYRLVAHGGSQWWTLSNDALTYIESYVAGHPRLSRFIVNSFIPDEFFFQTILSNSPFEPRIRGDDLRLVIWDRPELPRPAVLRQDDLDLLEASDRHFARKFDHAADPAFYDSIDAMREKKAEIAYPSWTTDHIRNGQRTS